MNTLFIITISIVLLLDSFNCLEQFCRAYIPKTSVKWFNHLTLNEPDFDIWLSTRLVKQQRSDAMVNKTSFDYFAEFRVKDSNVLIKYESEFVKRGIQVDVLVEDLYEHQRTRKRRSSVKSDSLPVEKIVGKYVSYEKIIEWMRHLQKSHPNIVKLNEIGETRLGNKLMVLVLAPPTRPKGSKKLVFFESGIHAREWISIATSIYMIDKLLKEYLANDAQTVKIFNQFDLHFLVMTNPDGYKYSYESPNNRFWRKNLGKAGGFEKNSCFGIDLNRNFDLKWMSSGSSSNPCSEVYAGTSPASEYEVTRLKRYILMWSPRWAVYFGLHSYGGYWLTPYSYSLNHIVENFNASCLKAMTAVKKMERKFDTQFEFGSASHKLYEAAGSSEDWTRVTAKIPYNYVIELRPTSNEHSSPIVNLGFDFPENKIRSSSREIYYGIKEYLVSFYETTFEKDIVKACNIEMLQMRTASGAGHREIPESK